MTQQKREESSNCLASRLSPLRTPQPSQSANSYASDQVRPRNSAVARSQAAPYSANVGDRMISVAVVDHHSFTRGCITRSIRDFDDHLEVLSFITPQDCLESKRALHLILYHAHETAGENMDERLAPIRKLLEVAPVIVLSAAENLEFIVEAFESGASGYIPTATTPAELVVEIIRLVRAGGTFVPPSGLQLKKISGKSPIPRGPTNEQFTPREIAVLKHLTQGKANKTIAYELAISESTVKIHIRHIMEKMHASNRTEVACRAQAFAKTVY
jgi:DNA-binding NarL/FixJ family response regulator